MGSVETKTQKLWQCDIEPKSLESAVTWGSITGRHFQALELPYSFQGPRVRLWVSWYYWGWGGSLTLCDAWERNPKQIQRDKFIPLQKSLFCGFRRGAGGALGASPLTHILLMSLSSFLNRRESFSTWRGKRLAYSKETRGQWKWVWIGHRGWVETNQL